MGDFKLVILPLLVNGHYTDFFFNVVLTQLFMFLRNNLELLLIFALAWQRFSKFTKTKWDDKASSWLVKFLSKRNFKGEKKK